MKIHVFDVDLTVIKKTSAELFISMALKKKLIRFSQVCSLPFEWVKYKLTILDFDFIENTVKKLSGIKRSEMEEIAQLVFEKSIKYNIYAGASEIIKDAQTKGEKVIFATSSFDFIIKPLENYFGITGSLASKMEYADGLTTGNLDGFSLFGKKKKTGAMEWMEKNSIDPADVCFYSDSYTDIPFLEYCGNPIAVNPDSKLARKAKKSGWKILRFKELLPPKT